MHLILKLSTFQRFTACRCFRCFIQGYIYCFTFCLYIALLFVACISTRMEAKFFVYLNLIIIRVSGKRVWIYLRKAEGGFLVEKFLFVCRGFSGVFLFIVSCFLFFLKKHPSDTGVEDWEHQSKKKEWQ